MTNEWNRTNPPISDDNPFGFPDNSSVASVRKQQSPDFHTIVDEQTKVENVVEKDVTIVEDNIISMDEDVVKKAPRGTPVSGGKRADIKPSGVLPAWGDSSNQDLGDGLNDSDQLSYTDLETLNKDLLHLRIRMNRIRREMRSAGRAAVEAKMRYQRAFRRALIQQSGGSAEMRKASAELECEDLEADMVMKQQVSDEYTTLFRAARDDVENVKTVAFNLRALSQII